jgi:tetratricopeptide (TPR) repeat protein
MDQQIQLLQQIQSSIWTLIYLVIAVLAINSIRAAAIVYKNFKERVSFATIASSMFDREHYDCTIDYCRSRLKKRPMDADAYFLLGRTFYRLKDYDRAEANFIKAAELQPTWKEDCEAYLDQIEAKRYSS